MLHIPEVSSGAGDNTSTGSKVQLLLPNLHSFPLSSRFQALEDQCTCHSLLLRLASQRGLTAARHPAAGVRRAPADAHAWGHSWWPVMEMRRRGRVSGHIVVHSTDYFNFFSSSCAHMGSFLCPTSFSKSSNNLMNLGISAPEIILAYLTFFFPAVGGQDLLPQYGSFPKPPRAAAIVFLLPRGTCALAR